MKLLVATDLSARSDQAIDRAFEIARAVPAEITVLHVVDDSLPASVARLVAGAAETEIRTRLAAMPDHAAVPVTVRIAEGNIFRTILAIADETDCDIVVLGRHRIESSDASFGGTTMGRVVRMGSRPVLVVAGRVEGAYKRAIVGIDFSLHARAALRSALALAPGAQFHLVHAFDVPFGGFLAGDSVRGEVGTDCSRQLGELIDEEIGAAATRRRDRVEVAGVVRQGDVQGVLRQEINRVRPDLLAIGTHGRNAVARAILGSVAEDFLSQPPCDLLVVRHRGEEG